MRIIGIDYGDARVGIAITDPLGYTAQGLETIQTKGSDKILLKRLEELIQEYQVTILVIGMPINLKGEKTVRAEKTQAFIHKLKCRFSKIRVETIDERLTTVAAHRTMNELNIKSNEKKAIVDTISAQYILEMYLNKNHCKKEKNSI